MKWSWPVFFIGMTTEALWQRFKAGWDRARMTRQKMCTLCGFTYPEGYEHTDDECERIATGLEEG